LNRKSQCIPYHKQSTETTVRTVNNNNNKIRCGKNKLEPQSNSDNSEDN